MPVIGFLSGVSPGPFVQRLAAFRQGLNETGVFEGRKVAIEYRWAEDQYDRLPALATDLVGRRVVVIVAYTDAAICGPGRDAAIPTASLAAVIRSGAGFCPSLNCPGESITRVSWFCIRFVPKQLPLRTNSRRTRPSPLCLWTSIPRRCRVT